MSNPKIGDKVLIHSKSVGYRLNNILKNHKIDSVPFFAWIRNIKRDITIISNEDVYVIWYDESTRNGGGDFYLRSDFDVLSGEMFSDKDFLL